MVITPREPWSIHEDSTGEFSLTLDAAPVNSVLFWPATNFTAAGGRSPACRGNPCLLPGELQRQRGS